jgi:histidinol-phosphate aminotransferase
MDINKLVRKHLLAVKPYSSARDEYKGEVKVALDANENPYGDTVNRGKFNRYPDPYQHEVKASLSKIKNIAPEHIFLGNGSDEPIDLLIRAFCEPNKDSILQLPPTYGMYQVSADINAIEVINVNLTGTFDIDAVKVLEAITENTKIVFFCSPNNPTGNVVNKNAIISVLQAFEGLVVVDEAYIDYTDSPSFISELGNYDNLIVLQTLSKAWGLANLRLGIAYASLEIIALLNKIKPPYNINGLTQEFALKALENEQLKNDMVTDVLKERERLSAEIAKISFIEKVYPSDANFILVKTPNGPSIYKQLADKQIIVRDRSKVVLLDNCLRITVGTTEENNILLATLAQVTL